MITVDKGQYVKLFLRNGMALEGIVEESTGAQVVLRSINDQSLMIIHRPSEDIMLTKVMVNAEMVAEPDPKPEPKPVPELSEMQVKIKEKLQEVQQISDPDLQNMSIADLRALVIEQEKQIIAQKRKEHFGSPGAAKLTQYSTPMTTVGRRVVPRKV